MAPLSASHSRRLLTLLAAISLGALSRAGSAAPATSQDTVQLAQGSAVAFATPAFLQTGRRYAFTWPGGGPPQTFTVKALRRDGWIQVEVAEENVDLALYVPGQFPVRWLHVGLAISIQEMRPLP